MPIRPPAVAGRFYPDDPVILAGTVDGFLASVASADSPPPRALIAPHAGYLYSGAVAASAFARLRRHRAAFDRVVLLGPSHFVPFEGLALPAQGIDGFATPLATVPVAAIDPSELAGLPQVVRADEPHAREHALEVELPFLLRALGKESARFELVPLAVGEATPEEVARVLDAFTDSRALVVVSTDLSHYLPYEEARRADERTSAAIERLDAGSIGRADACGAVPLRGLLVWARARGLACERLDLCNSGDTVGDPTRVVGYGAYAFA